MAHALQKLNQDNQDSYIQPQRAQGYAEKDRSFSVYLCAPLRPPRLDYLY